MASGLLIVTTSKTAKTFSLVMESNSANHEYALPAAELGESDAAAELGEPHFDEEATVLSARPVVPLEVVEAEQRSKKHLLFGLAIACSLMMGALAAKLIYKQRGNGQVSAIGTAVSGAAAIAAGEPASNPGTSEKVQSAGVSGQGVTKTSGEKSAPAISSSAPATAVDTRRDESLPPLVDERELTRPERIYGRRLRRRAERQAGQESGGRDRKSSDDLLRIRDIFEGPSRRP